MSACLSVYWSFICLSLVRGLPLGMRPWLERSPLVWKGSDGPTQRTLQTAAILHRVSEIIHKLLSLIICISTLPLTCII